MSNEGMHRWLCVPLRKGGPQENPQDDSDEGRIEAAVTTINGMGGVGLRLNQS